MKYFSAPLSWTSDGLYIASLCFAVIALAIVSCIVVQILAAEDHSMAHKRQEAPGPLESESSVY